MIYYDISDLFHHFREHLRVVGIPRVSTVTLQQFALTHADSEFRLIAFHPGLNKVVTTEGSFFKNRNFTARDFNNHFGVKVEREDPFDAYLNRKYKGESARRLHRMRMKAKSLIDKDYLARKGCAVPQIEPVRQADWEEPVLSDKDVIFIPGLISGFDAY